MAFGKKRSTIKKTANAINAIFQKAFTELDHLGSPNTGTNMAESHKAFLSINDNLVYEIQNHILSKKNPVNRIHAIEYWIAVMESCFKKGNFSAVECIRSALYGTPIFRLNGMKNQYANLSDSSKEFLIYLDGFFKQDTKDQALYENIKKASKPDSIPSFRVHKAQMIRLDEEIKKVNENLKKSPDNSEIRKSNQAILDKLNDQKNDRIQEFSDFQKNNRLKIQNQPKNPSLSFSLKIKKIKQKFSFEILSKTKTESEKKSENAELYTQSTKLEAKGKSLSKKSKRDYMKNAGIYKSNKLASAQTPKIAAAPISSKPESANTTSTISSHPTASAATPSTEVNPSSKVNLSAPEKINQSNDNLSLDEKIKSYQKRLEDGDPCQAEIIALMEEHSKDNRVFQLSKQSAKIFTEQLRSLDAQVFLDWDKQALYHGDISKSESDLIQKHGKEIGEGFYQGIKSSQMLIAHANQIANFVTQNILSFSSIESRTAALDYWIRAAYRLTKKEPFDFLGATQIFAALNKAEISRLKNTFGGLPTKTNEKLQKLTALFDPTNHFRNYNAALESHENQATIPNPTMVFQQVAPLQETYKKDFIFEIRDQLKSLEMELQKPDLDHSRKSKLESEKNHLQKILSFDSEHIKNRISDIDNALKDNQLAEEKKSQLKSEKENLQSLSQISSEKKIKIQNQFNQLDSLKSKLNQAKSELEKIKDDLKNPNSEKNQNRINKLCKEIQTQEGKIRALESENFSTPLDKMISENKKFDSQLRVFKNSHQKPTPAINQTLKLKTEIANIPANTDDANYTKSLTVEPRNVDLKNPMQSRLRSNARSQIRDAKDQINQARKRILSGGKKPNSENQDSSTITSNPADSTQQSTALATKLKSQIGNYDNGEHSDAAAKAILGDAGYAALHQASTNSAENNQSARKAFIDYLAQVLYDNKTDLEKISKKPIDNTIKIKDLLGEKGLALYLKAIEEEKNSVEFKNAVLLKSKKIFPGAKWSKRIVLWVAGPSAAGKTVSSNEILSLLNLELDKTPNNYSGNTIIAIDGEIGREVSQMSRLLLQVALQKGYSGIKDQHANTELDIKSEIQSAAEKNTNLHLLIPDTFADPTHALNIGSHQKFPNTLEVFSEVIANTDKNGSDTPQNDAAFQATVIRNGEARAFEKKPKATPINERELVMNHADIKINSKVYQAKYFEFGRSGSMVARKFYQNRMGENALYIPVRNDFIFVKFDSKQNEWMECSPQENEVIHLSKRNFEAFIQEQKNGSTTLDLPSWLEDKAKNNQLHQPPLVDLELKNFKIFMESIQTRFKKNEDCYADLSPLMAQLPKNAEVRSALQNAFSRSILIRAKHYREFSLSISQNPQTKKGNSSQDLSLALQQQIKFTLLRDFAKTSHIEERKIKFTYWLKVANALYSYEPRDLLSVQAIYESLKEPSLKFNESLNSLDSSSHQTWLHLVGIFSDPKIYHDFINALPPENMLIPPLLKTTEMESQNDPKPKADNLSQAPSSETIITSTPEKSVTKSVPSKTLPEKVSELRADNLILERQLKLLKEKEKLSTLLNNTHQKIDQCLQKQSEIISQREKIYLEREVLLNEIKALLDVPGSEDRQTEIIALIDQNKEKIKNLDIQFDFYEKQYQNQEKLRETVLKSTENLDEGLKYFKSEEVHDLIKNNNDQIQLLENQILSEEKQVDINELEKLESELNNMGFEFESDLQSAYESLGELDSEEIDENEDLIADNTKHSMAHIEESLFHEKALDELNHMGQTLKQEQVNETKKEIPKSENSDLKKKEEKEISLDTSNENNSDHDEESRQRPNHP